MNKYSLFMIMILFLLFITVIADSIAVTASVDITDNIPVDAHSLKY